MSNERQPLLTEEQIQELSEFPTFLRSHFERKYPKLYLKCVKGRVNVCFKNTLFLAFLRGKTKRVLNIDRLRKDVKAWEDDPDKKYPEWMKLYFDASELESTGDFELQPDDAVCIFAATIGINPDDYFEEVEVKE